MAAYDNSLFKYDAGYYEFLPGKWLPGKLVPGAYVTYTQKAIDAMGSIHVDDSDFLVAIYPKTGMTWTWVMINLILHAEDIEAGKEVTSTTDFMQMPIMELETADGIVGADVFKQLPPPRGIRTHLPVELYQNILEKHLNLKVIQTIRNPKDALVAFYHHLQNDFSVGVFTGTWDQFFELFKQKRLLSGDYFENVGGWYKFNKDRENSLVLRYEDMKQDHKGHVEKIAKFLGYNLSENVVDQIVEKSSLTSMQKDFRVLFEMAGQWEGKTDFVRKGVVGDWVNYFSQEQSDYVDALCKEHLDPLGLKFHCGQLKEWHNP